MGISAVDCAHKWN